MLPDDIYALVRKEVLREHEHCVVEAYRAGWKDGLAGLTEDPAMNCK